MFGITIVFSVLNHGKGKFQASIRSFPDGYAE